MSGCEDRKICLVSVSNNIANIIANVCSILVPRYCSDDYCVSNIRIPWALKGIRTLARDQALTLCVDKGNDPEVPTFLPTSNCSVARETSTRRTVL
ncbi:hypothetical protein SCLCIDRAFT_1222854 [Scleroderma citrinum Foug A]|uniref:Uncharacterized protein n=1 Tax=Scleroderma citrinum Foug A TaxID=1036808 RepID=A0A0C2YUR6_9AGAM|nr:hypothetical protein SCLCIDRAFT_1222854 [Scleroderma citrinum Foug A]